MAGDDEKHSVFGDQAGSVELLWGGRERPSRGPKPALSLERITRTAIALADTGGLGAVSMQRVAAELDFTKMSLYRYVPGKSELVALMIDRAMGEPPSAPSPDTAGRDGEEPWRGSCGPGRTRWRRSTTGIPGCWARPSAPGSWGRMNSAGPSGRSPRSRTPG
ncbi:TetR/AcrR family transcriptional regulator [Streptomyces lydicamycinicus]|uniref:TetR/AcrR family transcriptional regulator n=1 Tax=Streptomyces lydicamycinicus TaxID=1546107 RepID=UPI003D801133